MPDLDNITPAGGNEAPNSVDNTEDDQPVVDPKVEDPAPAPVTPPPSNAERAKAKAEAKAKEEAEAKPEEKPAEEAEDGDKKDSETLDTDVWGDSGDEVTNSVLLTLQNAGVSTEDAKALLWDAVAEGDPTKVDRDALIEKVGKANATLVMAGVENVTARNNAKLNEVVTIASDAAGGKDNWSKVAAWAKSGMDEAELNDLRGMLDAGGAKARFASAEIVKAYNADPKNTSVGATKKPMTGDSKSTAAVQGISRREYGEALDRLYRQGKREGSPEFKALQAKRQAGMKQGI